MPASRGTPYECWAICVIGQGSESAAAVSVRDLIDAATGHWVHDAPLIWGPSYKASAEAMLNAMNGGLPGPAWELCRVVVQHAEPGALQLEAHYDPAPCAHPAESDGHPELTQEQAARLGEHLKKLDAREAFTTAALASMDAIESGVVAGGLSDRLTQAVRDTYRAYREAEREAGEPSDG